MKRKKILILISIILIVLILSSVGLYVIYKRETRKYHSSWPPDGWTYHNEAIYDLTGKESINISMGPFEDDEGNVLVGLNITFHLNGTNISAITDSNGEAIMVITYPIEYGLYNITYQKDDYFKEEQVYLEVKKFD